MASGFLSFPSNCTVHILDGWFMHSYSIWLNHPNNCNLEMVPNLTVWQKNDTSNSGQKLLSVALSSQVCTLSCATELCKTSELHDEPSGHNCTLEKGILPLSSQRESTRCSGEVFHGELVLTAPAAALNWVYGVQTAQQQVATSQWYACSSGLNSQQQHEGLIPLCTRGQSQRGYARRDLIQMRVILLFNGILVIHLADFIEKEQSL